MALGTDEPLTFAGVPQSKTSAAYGALRHVCAVARAVRLLAARERLAHRLLFGRVELGAVAHAVAISMVVMNRP